MGDDADVLKKLSKMLETQSLGGMTDGESTQELLGKISAQMGDVSVMSGNDGNFLRSMNTSTVQMPNRKTPYEVWSEKQKTPAKKVSMLSVIGGSQASSRAVLGTIVVWCLHYGH